MKPRIFYSLVYGLWECFSFTGKTALVWENNMLVGKRLRDKPGFGYTPEQAYNEWLDVNNYKELPRATIRSVFRQNHDRGGSPRRS